MPVQGAQVSVTVTSSPRRKRNRNGDDDGITVTSSMSTSHTAHPVPCDSQPADINKPDKADQDSPVKRSRHLPPLAQWLKQEGNRLTRAACLAFIKYLGVAAFHHQNLKFENIMVKSDGTLCLRDIAQAKEQAEKSMLEYIGEQFDSWVRRNTAEHEDDSTDSDSTDSDSEEEDDDGSRQFVPDNQSHTIWFIKYAKSKCKDFGSKEMEEYREIRVTHYRDTLASALRVDGGWDVAFGGNINGIFNNEHPNVKNLDYRYLGPIIYTWDGRGGVKDGCVFSIEAPTFFGF
jgi:hypothetical protein